MNEEIIAVKECKNEEENPECFEGSLENPNIPSYSFGNGSVFDPLSSVVFDYFKALSEYKLKCRWRESEKA
jgi:hypothetical protein